MKQLRKSNEGFSLVETLIAMTVLVICAIPLLKAFVLAGKNNLSGRQLLNATAIAENFIEEIKANGVETYGMGWNQTTFVTIDGKNYPIYMATYPEYLFDGKKYKVEITMTPSTQQAGETNALYHVNGQMTPQLNAMNAMTDAVYVQAVDDTDKVVESYADAHIGVSASSLLNDMKVTYNFVVDYAPLSGTAQSGTNQKKYYMINQQIVYSKSDDTVIAQKSECIYCSNEEQPRNLYICYVPESDNDVINVTLTNNVLFTKPLNVYLARQGITETTEVNLNLNNNSISGEGFALRSNMPFADMNLMKDGASLAEEMAKQLVDYSSLSKEVDGGVAVYEVIVTVSTTDGDELTSLTGTALR